MAETFTKWWRRNRERIAEGHMTIEQAQAEFKPLRDSTLPPISEGQRQPPHPGKPVA